MPAFATSGENAWPVRSSDRPAASRIRSWCGFTVAALPARTYADHSGNCGSAEREVAGDASVKAASVARKLDCF